MGFLHRTMKDGQQKIGINSFGCSLATFTKLFPNYKLDPQFVIREYEPGLRHKLQRADGSREHGPANWEEGTSYIRRAEYIEGWVTAYESRKLTTQLSANDIKGDQIAMPRQDGSKRLFSKEFTRGYKDGLAARGANG